MIKIHVFGNVQPNGAFALSMMATNNGNPLSENTLNTVYQVLRAVNMRSLILIWEEGCWDERQWA